MTREAGPCYEFGPFRLDLSEQTLLRDGRPLPLTPKIFEVLRLLVQNAGHLVEKDRLLKEVWPDSFVEEGALSRCVSVLRKTLGDPSSGQKFIETVPKRGYRFIAPVTECLHDESKSRVGPRARAAEIEATRTAPDTSRMLAARTGISWWAVGVGAALLTTAAVFYAVVPPREPAREASSPFAPAHREVTFSGKEGTPALSPDGRRIAYMSHETPESKLMVQELD